MTIHWCDKCGVETNKLTAFMAGTPSELREYLNNLTHTKELALCKDCLEEVRQIIQSCGMHKSYPKNDKIQTDYRMLRKNMASAEMPVEFSAIVDEKFWDLF